uniref:Contactin n=1 Tax=Parastrongyloides trichosuri TaxID=131310 RepID=A0A0N5A0L5_PARTI
MNLKCLHFLLLLIAFDKILSYKNFQCPNGWLNVGYKCIKLVYDKLDTNGAVKKCKSLSNSELVGFFMESENINFFRKQLFNVIENKINKGLNEPIWLLSDQTTLMKYNKHMSDMEYDLWNQTSSVLLSNKSIALEYNDKKCCNIISVDQYDVYPFICVLSKNEIKRKLFEESLIKESSPELIEMPKTHYFYSSIDDTTIKLNCKSSYMKTTNIVWYKDEVEKITFSGKNNTYVLSGGSLIIPIAKNQRDVEDYHCVASNEYGSVRSPKATIVPTYIDNFRSTRLPEFTYSDDNTGTRIECLAPKHYPKSYSYTWLHSDSTEKFVSQNERVFISMDGSLFFSYNIKSDSKTYACSIALDTIGSGQYGPFFKFILPQNTRVDGPEQGFSPVIEEYKPQIFPDNPSLGKTVYIECFAYGFPTPIYKWSRIDGTPLPKQAKLLNYGRILKIENITMEDSGKYICTAENTLGTDFAEVYLSLKRPPIFLDKLYDVSSPTNTTIELRCPLMVNKFQDYYEKDTSLEWFKNGIPINPLLMADEDRTRIIINYDHLTILNSKERDSGTYQCLATNDVSYDTTYCYVKVQDSLPKFHSKQFPKKIIAIKGVKLDVPCLYTASPIGRSSWKSLETNSYISYNKDTVWQTINDGNIATLHFEKLEESNTGLYECIAENVIGSSSAVIKIIVIEKPSIHISSLGWSDDTARLKCEVEMYCDETNDCPETQINWQLNDNHLFNKQVNMNEYKTKINIREISSKYSNGLLKINQISTLDIKGTINKKDISRFSCQSIFGTAITEVKPTSLIPENYFLMKIDNIIVSENDITFNWFIEENIKIELKKYKDMIVLAQWTNKNDNKWITFKEISQNKILNSDIFSFKITDLNEGEYYKFRILIKIGNNKEIQIESNRWIYLFNTSIMDENYVFGWKKLKDDIIELNWEIFPIDNEMFDNDYYNVSWSYYVSHIENGNDELTQLSFYDIVKGKTKRINMPSQQDIIQCRKIKVKIVPLLKDIDNNNNVIKKEIILSNNINDLKIDKIQIIALNSTSIKIDWSWDKKKECAEAYGTKIMCYYKNNSNPFERSITKLISNIYTTWIIDNLYPETQYNCTVIPIDENGKHGKVKIYKVIVTKEEAPKESPRLKGIDIKWKKDNASVILQWSPIKLLRSQNRRKIDYINNVGYIIYVYEGSTAEIPAQLKIPLSTFIHPNDLSVELKGLNLMFEYKISVAGYNEGGIGKESKQRIIRIGSYNSMQTISLFSSSSYNKYYIITTVIILMIRYIIIL